MMHSNLLLSTPNDHGIQCFVQNGTPTNKQAPVATVHPIQIAEQQQQHVLDLTELPPQLLLDFYARQLERHERHRKYFAGRADTQRANQHLDQALQFRIRHLQCLAQCHAERADYLKQKLSIREPIALEVDGHNGVRQGASLCSLAKLRSKIQLHLHHERKCLARVNELQNNDK
jgi:hypothetical protein